VTAPAPAPAAASVSGVVDLCVPADWAEILLPDAEEAQSYFAQLVRQTWPNGSEQLWRGGTEVLLSWRSTMLDRGAVSHGVVSAPHPDGGTAQWHVLTSVVELPVAPELDVTAMLAELVRAQGHDVQYVEQFETDMGLGVGMMGQHEVAPPAGLEALAARGLTTVDEPVRVGMAAALACEPGAAHALLVVGVCLDPDQVVELAGLVAVIAGRSRVRPAPAETDGEDGRG
jgi:hypothetical protein